MGWFQRFVIVAAVIAVGTVAFVAGYWARGAYVGVGREAAGDLAKIEDAYREIVENSDDPPDTDALADGAIKGMVGVLRKRSDPYASFYPPEDYVTFQELTSGEFTGIGVWLKRKAGELTVISVLPKTPAEDSGLESGDVLVEVGDRAVADMTSDQAVDAIKGPAGSKVRLTVRRGSEELEFAIERKRLDLPNLEASREGRFGHVQLFGFARGAGDQLRDEVDGLLDDGADGIVLDLRDNGGGLLSEAIEVASVFIEDGTIATFEQRTGPDRTYEAEGDAFEDVPLIVLVNEATASASEVVAGALQDLDRAELVGTTTYGKGSVQEVVQFGDASALKLTIGSYHTPLGRDLNGKGLEPDVEVAGRGAQLARALELLDRQAVAS